MINIQNDNISVTINHRGAELQGLFNKDNGIDYLWNGNPAYWSKTSPVLFPIVGSLKNDTCYVNGKPYQMSRHGFARDMSFMLIDQSVNTVTFRIVSNDETLRIFPFTFRFEITYSITGSELSTTYRVHNTGTEMMYFSVGGHPAFKVPLTAGGSYEDYYLEFSNDETAERWPISAAGLIENQPASFFHNNRRVPLTKDLFYNDAIVFKSLRSTSVKLLDNRSDHGIEFNFTGFPYLGLWAAKNADFVCIEPWCGIADAVDSNQQLKDKEGIIGLSAGGKFERTWRVRIF